MKPDRVYALIFASVYPHYVKKVETKGRTREEVDECIRWLTEVRTGSDSDWAPTREHKKEPGRYRSRF